MRMGTFLQKRKNFTNSLILLVLDCSLSGGEAVSLSLKTGAVQTGGSLSIGHGLKWESGALCVDCADAVETDNTLPVTSAAVAVEVGNIAVLLGTI